MKIQQIKKGIWVVTIRTKEGNKVQFVSRINMVDAMAFAFEGMGWKPVEVVA